ncbi:MAG: hypothetical protein EWV87_18890 [Microcystis panniformis Mp_GB_SS_20050300_S99]|nr:MAG: hypothetical protein EWV87_18890 [Microcystis panniformis Mp_GB_SS_20050300_S99]
MTGLLGEPFKGGFVKSILKEMPEKRKKSWFGGEEVQLGLEEQRSGIKGIQFFFMFQMGIIQTFINS